MHRNWPYSPQHLSVRYHPYGADNFDRSLRNPATAGQEAKGNPPMLEIAFIVAVGIFMIGIVTGIVVLVSVGIRREERRFQEEHGIWGSPDGLDHYITENAADAVSSVGRSVNGLYVRHLPARVQRDLSQGVLQ